MTEHEKLMLKRHLERAKRWYIEAAMTCSEIGDMPAATKTYAEHAENAQLMIDKLNLGLIRVLK